MNKLNVRIGKTLHSRGFDVNTILSWAVEQIRNDRRIVVPELGERRRSDDVVLTGGSSGVSAHNYRTSP